MTRLSPGETDVLLVVDMQNDFLHPDGAYGRAGVRAPEIAALLKPVADVMRQAGGHSWRMSAAA